MKTRLAASVLLALLASFSTSRAVETKPARISETASVFLKLTRGEVSEDVILAYVQNAKRNFDLSADDIVYLKQQGVSDKIVTAALSHRVQLPRVAITVPQAQPQQQPAQAAAVQQPAQTIIVTPPQTPYVQSAPQPVYVYSSPSYSYYDPYPYYTHFPYRYSYFPYRSHHYGYHHRPSLHVNFGLGHGHHHSRSHHGGHFGHGGHRGGHFGGGGGSHHRSFNSAGAHRAVGAAFHRRR